MSDMQQLPGEAMNPSLSIDVVTLFPEMFRGVFEHSIVGRARAAGLVDVALHDPREHALDKHHKVDDTPFGGGGGMVLKPEPLFSCVEEITGATAGEFDDDVAVVLLSPAGRPFDQACARRLAGLSRLVLVCGRYEGVDERVREGLCTEALSVGDYVLSGGEPAAITVADAVVRLLPGALGNPESATTESFETGLLEAPHYTRPAEFRGLSVPTVLLSGDHAAVDRHRRQESLLGTARVRPDLLARAEASGLLDAADRALLEEARADGLAPSIE